MKILYINTSGSPDYQADAIYHGLKSLYGLSVESLSDMWYMYDSISERDRRFLYGKGFTLYGNLSSNDRMVVSLEEAISNIKINYYNYIVYGSIKRSNELLQTVVKYYPLSKIALVDGEDEPAMDDLYYGQGLYFKRELTTTDVPAYVRPIGFAIPADKIIDSYIVKIRDWSVNYPGKQYTYVHDEETSYYDDYQKSKYAVTFKKAGWDCLRHYEIIMNGCLPYFVDIESCPKNTLVALPKSLLIQIKKEIDQGTLSLQQYEQYVSGILQHARNHLTTVALASYMLRELEKVAHESHNYVQVGHKTVLLIPKAGGDFDGGLEDGGILFVDTMHKSPHLFRHAHRYKHIYAHDHFSSAIAFVAAKTKNITSVNSFLEIPTTFDKVLLELNLPYETHLADYFVKIRSKLKPNAPMTIVVPNAYRWLTIKAFIRGELVSDYYFSNKPSVNTFTPKSICRLLKSMGFGNIKVEGKHFKGGKFARWLSKWLPIVKILHSKLLVVTCQMEKQFE